MSVNKVTLMGNLTREPELSFVGANKTPLVKCSIAINRSIKDGDGWRDEVTFVEFEVWSKRAEAFAKYHRKGSKAYLEGRLTVSQWKDRNTGDNRSKMSVTVENWEFVGEKSTVPAVNEAPAGLDDPF